MSALILLIVVIISLLCFALYKRGTKNFGYWKKIGVKEMKGQLPFLGDNYQAVLKQADPYEVIQRYYNAFKEDR